MKTNTSSPITNGILMLAVSAGLAVLGGLLTNWLMYSGLALSLVFVVLWSLHTKFNSFMENRIKLFSFVKYDFKNDPIHYTILLCIWFTVLFWLFKDLSEYREVGTDVLLGLFSIYLVSCVMVLLGYYRDYERLP